MNNDNNESMHYHNTHLVSWSTVSNHSFIFEDNNHALNGSCKNAEDAQDYNNNRNNAIDWGEEEEELQGDQCAQDMNQDEDNEELLRNKRLNKKKKQKVTDINSNDVKAEDEIEEEEEDDEEEEAKAGAVAFKEENEMNADQTANISQGGVVVVQQRRSIRKGWTDLKMETNIVEGFTHETDEQSSLIDNNNKDYMSIMTGKKKKKKKQMPFDQSSLQICNYEIEICDNVITRTDKENFDPNATGEGFKSKSMNITNEHNISSVKGDDDGLSHSVKKKMTTSSKKKKKSASQSQTFSKEESHLKSQNEEETQLNKSKSKKSLPNSSAEIFSQNVSGGGVGENSKDNSNSVQSMPIPKKNRVLIGRLQKKKKNAISFQNDSIENQSKRSNTKEENEVDNENNQKRSSNSGLREKGEQSLVKEKDGTQENGIIEQDEENADEKKDMMATKAGIKKKLSKKSSGKSKDKDVSITEKSKDQSMTEKRKDKSMTEKSKNKSMQKDKDVSMTENSKNVTMIEKHKDLSMIEKDKGRSLTEKSQNKNKSQNLSKHGEEQGDGEERLNDEEEEGNEGDKGLENQREVTKGKERSRKEGDDQEEQEEGDNEEGDNEEGEEEEVEGKEEDEGEEEEGECEEDEDDEECKAQDPNVIPDKESEQKGTKKHKSKHYKLKPSLDPNVIIDQTDSNLQQTDSGNGEDSIIDEQKRRMEIERLAYIEFERIKKEEIDRIAQEEINRRLEAQGILSLEEEQRIRDEIKSQIPIPPPMIDLQNLYTLSKKHQQSTFRITKNYAIAVIDDPFKANRKSISNSQGSISDVKKNLNSSINSGSNEMFKLKNDLSKNLDPKKRKKRLRRPLEETKKSEIEEEKPKKEKTPELSKIESASNKSVSIEKIERLNSNEILSTHSEISREEIKQTDKEVNRTFTKNKKYEFHHNFSKDSDLSDNEGNYNNARANQKGRVAIKNILIKGKLKKNGGKSKSKSKSKGKGMSKGKGKGKNKEGNKLAALKLPKGKGKTGNDKENNKERNDQRNTKQQINVHNKTTTNLNNNNNAKERENFSNMVSTKSSMQQASNLRNFQTVLPIRPVYKRLGTGSGSVQGQSQGQGIGNDWPPMVSNKPLSAVWNQNNSDIINTQEYKSVSKPLSSYPIPNNTCYNEVTPTPYVTSKDLNFGYEYWKENRRRSPFSTKHIRASSTVQANNISAINPLQQRTIGNDTNTNYVYNKSRPHLNPISNPNNPHGSTARRTMSNITDEDIERKRKQLLDCLKDPNNPYSAYWHDKVLGNTYQMGVASYDTFCSVPIISLVKKKEESTEEKFLQIQNELHKQKQLEMSKYHNKSTTSFHPCSKNHNVIENYQNIEYPSIFKYFN